jgi:hypothetical protein
LPQSKTQPAQREYRGRLNNIKEINVVEDKKTITIDDVEYTEDQLTDQAKMCINHINSLDQKIGSAEFNLDQLRVGRNAFIDMLKKELPDEG